jgi:hypothetical protein
LLKDTEESGVGYIEINTTEDILKKILEIFSTVAKRDGETELELEAVVDKIPPELRRKLAKIECGDRVERQFNIRVGVPAAVFATSNLSYEEYLRTHYKSEIEAGYLPIASIADQDLRERVRIEKSRGTLPKDLDRVCVLRKQQLHELRTCIAQVAGINDIGSDEYKSFAVSLIPQRSTRSRSHT